MWLWQQAPSYQSPRWDREGCFPSVGSKIHRVSHPSNMMVSLQVSYFNLPNPGKQLSTWKNNLANLSALCYLSDLCGVTNVYKFSLVPRLRKICEPGKVPGFRGFPGSSPGVKSSKVRHLQPIPTKKAPTYLEISGYTNFVVWLANVTNLSPTQEVVCVIKMFSLHRRSHLFLKKILQGSNFFHPPSFSDNKNHTKISAWVPAAFCLANRGQWKFIFLNFGSEKVREKLPPRFMEVKNGCIFYR